MKAVDIKALVDAIELCQAVLNKDDLIGVDKSVSRVAELGRACPDSVSFLSNGKYQDELQNSQAGVVLVSEKFSQHLTTANPDTLFIIVKDAYLAHASISTLFAYHEENGIHKTAIISPTAHIGQNVHIGAYSVIGNDVVIGDDVVIERSVTVDAGVHIGRSSFIANGVVIAHHSMIGENVRIHSQASIGSEGFGFAPKMTNKGMAWERIAQLGRVVIGDRVRIGANTCIDRGAVGDTIIADDVIIDNLVQIAHNVHIGSGTAIAANTGIAGSTTIGKNCIIGGACGIVGHISIADGVTLTSMTMVTNAIKQAGVYSSGVPAMPSMQWRRAAVKFRQSGEK